MTAHQRGVAMLAALVLLITPGCGNSAKPRPPLHPIKGRITVAGHGAAGLTVTFHPLSGDVTLLPTATTQPDGSYTLGTYAPGDGVPEGEYAVAITWWQSENPDGDAPQVDRLGGRYVNPATSGLKATIKPDSSQLEPFSLP